MGITRAIKNTYEQKKFKKWDRLYFFFDVHATIIKPNYKYGDIPTEFYPYAVETLQLLSKVPEVVMILYTCSHPHEIQEYIRLFDKNNIRFDYINGNPEVETQKDGYGCYDEKPYMNLLFEDKAGFSGDEDWEPVLKLFKEIYNA